MNDDTGRLLAPGEAARILGVHPRTVTRWAEAGKLTAIRTPGRIRRYWESEVRAILQRGQRR